MGAPVKTLRSRKAFADWLGQELWLCDAFVDRIDPLPSPGEVPDEAHLVFRVQVAGGIRAGEWRRMRDLILSASGVSRFELPAGGFASGNCCEGADIGDDSSSPISLVVDVPLDLRLDCAEIEVVEREWEETVPAWFSDREFDAVVSDSALPSPEQWTKALAGVGLHVVWRCYGGPAEEQASVPLEYDGWFLQQANQVASTVGGVLVLVVKCERDGFHVRLQRPTEEADPLWFACAKFLGSFPEIVVHCGNTSLSGSAWLEYLARCHAPPHQLSLEVPWPAL